MEDDALYFVTVCCAKRDVSQLDREVAFSIMVQALEHYQSTGKWRVTMFLAMPDHWHGLMQFPEPGDMEKTLKDWKRYVAKNAGVGWQDGFFEHRLRTRQSADEKWHYIMQNPVRKGLASVPEEWPFVWLPKTAG